MTLFGETAAFILIALGVLAIIVEILLLGFSVFILFFIGLSLILTGIANYFGLLSDTWVSLLLSNAILTSVLSMILWKPLKKMQDQTATKKVSSDFHGLTFYVDEEVDSRGECRYKYSGISWKVKSENPIAAGTQVEVYAVDVGVFWVRPV